MTLANDVAPLEVDLETIPPAPECLRQRVTDLGLNPEPQLQMAWSPEPWLNALGDLPHTREYLEDLAKRMTEKYGQPAVSRNDVFDEVRTQISADRIHLAFIVVMIWGYGTTGYGAHRTSEILRQSETAEGGRLSDQVIESLKKSADLAASGSPGTHSFYVLNNRPTKIAGLGPAFFTKWLSFASMHNNPDEDSALPILDDVVAVWIKRHTSSEDSPGLDLDPQKSQATRRYHQYLQLLDSWRSELPYNYTRTQLERAIFSARAWDKSCSNFANTP